MSSPRTSRAGSPSRLPPVPSSPVYSMASTAANRLSHFDLPLPPAPRPAHAVLSKSDLEASQQAYSDLVASAKSYRQALANLSSASSTFGSALESCARLKEARADLIPGVGVGGGGSAINNTFSHGGGGAGSASCTADMLLSASGVHHLVANHHQILSETVYRSFEVPLLHDLDKWQTVIEDEEETYQQNIQTQSKQVRRLEKEGLKLHNQRRRDVARFRAHLVELTRKLDGLTTLHADHSTTLLRESQETSARIVDASCSLVRAEVDIFESLARKGWTGGGLDDLLEKGVDLFAIDDLASAAAASGGGGGGGGGGGPASSDSSATKLFSILPPKSILAAAEAVAAGSPPQHDGLLVDSAERYPSLAALTSPTANNGRQNAAPGDADSVLSGDSNRQKPRRGARPFSPQPIRKIPANVTHDSLAVGDSHDAIDEEDEDDVDTQAQRRRADDADNNDNNDDDDDNDDDATSQERRGRRRSQSSYRDTDVLPHHHGGTSSADAWAT